LSLTNTEVAHLLIALTLLVVVAHALGHLFATMRQPPVIGEILGGLLLGPTVLGSIDSSATTWLYPSSGVTASVLGAVYYLGLLLLMFLAGGEVHVSAGSQERRTVLAVTASGLLLPFCAGIVIVQMLDWRTFAGAHGSRVTFGLVFGIAIAVTSIPVISRIMLDLGILRTQFARVVLSVAVLEDVALYVVLAVVLGLVQAQSNDAYGLPTLLGIDSVAMSATYYVVTAVLFLGLFLVRGATIFRLLASSPVNLLEKRNPTAFRFAFLLLLGVVCFGLGINPIFGALMAGVSASRADHEAPTETRQAWDALRRFSLAFFIPLYFAVVGLKLDLVHHLDPVFFLWFFLAACAIKSVSVWLGAKLAGQDGFATNLAVALNARGGPGIVLATVTFSAGIINENFFTSLVLLSILSSQIAGFWLDWVFVRKPARAPEPSWAGPTEPAHSAER
jgi:Kef-type K+ transport system membrane component KefB